jgi:excisionase family DNA binding protein
MDELLTTSDVARALNRSADRVRGYEREGKLPAQRTRSGQRLFKASDVDRLAKQLCQSGTSRNRTEAPAPRR